MATVAAPALPLALPQSAADGELADRAVFMEKGEVRFEGPAHELRDRHDLVRAVFLGADGG